MLPRTLTRYQITVIIAALLVIVAFGLGNRMMAGAVVLAFLTLTGLGVAIPQLSLFGPFICQGNNSRRWVALTFDDGPDARSTPALLELLREAEVKAAFFCIGNRLAAQPGLAAQIIGEGHLLENHSYTHSNATNVFTVRRLRAELADTQAAIKQATGTVARCFRPPMGLSNPRIFQAARTLDLKVVGWSARGLDTRLTDPEKIVQRIARRLKPGAIILLHDGNIPAERLVATVKLLLGRLRLLGYEVVRLDRILT